MLAWLRKCPSQRPKHEPAADSLRPTPFTPILARLLTFYPYPPFIRYDTRVIVSFLGFAAFCVLNWIAFAIRSLTTSPDQRLHMFSQHMGTFLVASYVFYPSLSLMQLKVRCAWDLTRMLIAAVAWPCSHTTTH